MAKDVIMKKGKDEITVTQDFIDHYIKLGYKLEEKNVCKKSRRNI